MIATRHWSHTVWRAHVKTGTVPKVASKWLERAKLYREQADYGDFYIVSPEEAETQVKSAREFIEEIENAIGRLKKED